jgi:hypothetical protein
LLTVKSAGEMFRYFAMADGGTNMALGKRCCRFTKLRTAVGATRKPLADARCRSMITYPSGCGRSVFASMWNELIGIPPLSWPLAM